MFFKIFQVLLFLVIWQNPANANIYQQWYVTKINLPQIWEMELPAGEIIVAIIDTGMDLGHGELKNSLWVNTQEIPNNQIDDDNNGYVDDINGWDFQANDNIPTDEDQTQVGHGTIAAGVIRTIAHKIPIKLMVIRAFDLYGLSSDKIIAHSIDYAVSNGAQIINASFGGYKASDSSLMIEAIERARKKDVVIIASAGNYGESNDSKEFLPANLRLDNVISVAASGPDDTKWLGSNYGSRNVDISAPGIDIFTTKLGNTYGSVTGTSIATPVITGVAALMKSAAPLLSAQSIKTILLNTGIPVPIKTVCNCRVDAFAAVKAAIDQ